MTGRRDHLPGGICPCCGGTAYDHCHTLTAGIASGLWAVYQAAKCDPVRISEVIRSRNVIDNFQKLRYWGLVDPNCSIIARNGKTYTDGVWRVTPRGERFVTGQKQMPRRVWTWRGDFLEWAQPVRWSYFTDLDPGFIHLDGYRAVMRPHNGMEEFRDP